MAISPSPSAQRRLGQHNLSRRARLQTAALLRFICSTIAATLILDRALEGVRLR
jgi:hypothetical protein